MTYSHVDVIMRMLVDGSCSVTHDLDEPAYAYLLGQYLGDGCISRMRSSFRLRITCCSAYPRIIDECAEAIRRLRPTGRVGFVNRQGCIEVCNYWLHWPCVLPHGEGGVKHTRAIDLADWQRGIAVGRCVPISRRRPGHCQRVALAAAAAETAAHNASCPGWDSNPHWTEFETVASADWGTGAG